MRLNQISETIAIAPVPKAAALLMSDDPIRPCKIMQLFGISSSIILRRSKRLERSVRQKLEFMEIF